MQWESSQAQGVAKDPDEEQGKRARRIRAGRWTTRGSVAVREDDDKAYDDFDSLHATQFIPEEEKGCSGKADKKTRYIGLATGITPQTSRGQHDFR